MQNLGPENRHFGKIRWKIEFLSTHNVLRWKFAAVCRKIANFWPAYFLTHNASASQDDLKTKATYPEQNRTVFLKKNQ